MKISGVKVKLAERASATCVGCPVGAPYQDRLDQDAVEPVADMEKQPTVAVRDLETEKGLLSRLSPVVRQRCNIYIYIYIYMKFKRKSSLRK